MSYWWWDLHNLVVDRYPEVRGSCMNSWVTYLSQNSGVELEYFGLIFNFPFHCIAIACKSRLKIFDLSWLLTTKLIIENVLWFLSSNVWTMQNSDRGMFTSCSTAASLALNKTSAYFHFCSLVTRPRQSRGLLWQVFTWKETPIIWRTCALTKHQFHAGVQQAIRGAYDEASALTLILNTSQMRVNVHRVKRTSKMCSFSNSDTSCSKFCAFFVISLR